MDTITIGPIKWIPRKPTAPSVKNTLVNLENSGRSVIRFSKNDGEKEDDVNENSGRVVNPISTQKSSSPTTALPTHSSTSSKIVTIPETPVQNTILDNTEHESSENNNNQDNNQDQENSGRIIPPRIPANSTVSGKSGENSGRDNNSQNTTHNDGTVTWLKQIEDRFNELEAWLQNAMIIAGCVLVVLIVGSCLFCCWWKGCFSKN